MDLKKLEKATKVFEQIKALDAEIIEIDRFAMLVANGEIKSSFELKVEDPGKKKEDAEKVTIGEDGSLLKGDIESMQNRIMSYVLPPPYILRFHENENKKESEHLLKHELSASATMRILGVLLLEKQELRQSLLSRLEKLGVSAV